MNTPSKAEKKRPTLVENRNGDKSHYQSDEADARFESLEAALAREKERSARLREALDLLYAEVKKSGNATKNDFGWPAAVSATKEALKSLEGQ